MAVNVASWDLLDEKAEFDLHKSRLLAVEERPFKRITKRLSSTPSLVATGTPLKTPDTAAELLKEDFTLDFAAFDSSLVRLQFLHDANARERERYRDDQERILRECQAARDTNAQLREQLEGARATLAQRRRFDEMADKITSNRLLRPREEQVTNLAKLEEECRELERESETYSVTWKERRDQFNRIMEEGMLLRRQIRDEKEEVDRREGMNEGGEDETAGQTPRPEQSRNGSPSPDGDGQSKAEGEGGTSQVAASHRGTPAPDGSHLHPGDGQSVAGSRNGSRQPSREPSPLAREEGEDEEMEDQRDSRNMTETGTPQLSVDPPENTGDRMELDT
jgi:hypothetical protein